MCGIVGYLGNQQAKDILISGLEKLEYRGYDSAGIAVISEGELFIERAVGRLSNLKEKVNQISALQKAKIGIGHTRWATHGGPSEVNAHPHRSESLALCHNGIIENYQTLRQDLESKGYQFCSETDTEVATHLFKDLIKSSDSPIAALYELMQTVEGSFAFVAFEHEDPETLLVARRASPLVIGIGVGEVFVASDVPPLLKHTRKVIYLEDEDYALLKKDRVEIYHAGKLVEREVVEIDWDLSQAEKGGYDHFMIKEIFEQPKAVNDTLSGRLVSAHTDFKILELESLKEQIKHVERIKLIACGTAWHACLLGKSLIEYLARIPCDVEIASEFRYQSPIVTDRDLLITVSQSGETADTLAAVKLIADTCPSVCITNVLGSSLSREVDASILTQAGPEISVASTKAFVTQVVSLYLLAIKFGQIKEKLNAAQVEKHLDNITHTSQLIHKTLQLNDSILELAEKYKSYRRYFFLGRGLAYPIALEGALKLKEVSYLNAQAYPAGELKHGPIALIDEDYVSIAIIQREEPFCSKTISNINEVRSRKGKVIIITDLEDLSQLRSVADDIIQIPYQSEPLMPILATIPLQLYAYHIANLHGCEIDFPRNLAKSVTVE